MKKVPFWEIFAQNTGLNCPRWLATSEFNHQTWYTISLLMIDFNCVVEKWQSFVWSLWMKFIFGMLNPALLLKLIDFFQIQFYHSFTIAIVNHVCTYFYAKKAGYYFTAQQMSLAVFSAWVL